MPTIDPNLRKAAVMLRSLDGDTAALMLAQLSPQEAAVIREAMRAVGAVSLDEQAHVVAELRGASTPKKSASTGDVELSLSSAFQNDSIGKASDAQSAARSSRFEFLEKAPITALVPYLAREHAQTVAVVLSHLPPQRAAAVLAELPQQLQVETIERLSTLGETDPETVSILERELEAWFSKRSQPRSDGRRNTMATILAAADAKARSQILGGMKNRNITSTGPDAKQRPSQRSSIKPMSDSRQKSGAPAMSATNPPRHDDRSGLVEVRRPLRVSRDAFDDLMHLDSRTLTSVLRQMDASVLALALADSREELVDRICENMPKRTARAFRRELRNLRPTRLSDVQAAQQAVVQIAAQELASRRAGLQPAGYSVATD